jgi:hypothetical protein
MALVPKVGLPTVSSTLVPQNEQIPELRAGEAIAAGDLCVIANTGLVMRVAGGGAVVHGVAATNAQIGQPITLYRNVRFGYGAGMTPGTVMRVSPGVAGAIDDAGAGLIVGYAVDAERIQFRGL